MGGLYSSWAFWGLALPAILERDRPRLAEVAACASGALCGLCFLLPLSIAVPMLAGCSLFAALICTQLAPRILPGLAGLGAVMPLVQPDTSVAPALGLLAAAMCVAWDRDRHLRADRTDLEDRLERRTHRIRFLLGERDEVTTLAVHDLQSPIQAISGMQKTLLHMLDTADADRHQMRQALKAAIATNEDLSARIGSLLDGSRDYLGGDRETTQVRRVLEQAKAAHVLALKEKRIAVKLAVAPSLSLRNGEDVIDILDVLLDNAIQHSPDGSNICLSAAPIGPGRLGISIDDEGPGIDPKTLQTLFEPKATGRRGIGLHLARRRARLLGGELTLATSKLGGSCFELHLPSAEHGA
ncbi:sensor histidine kinase [Pseudaestuariivita sp.]|uniref:sensor histidine kinase n=1 Tax=Pseudaestuariivita sp. TaxID=2211669 RepID=UPI004058C66E